MRNCIKDISIFRKKKAAKKPRKKPQKNRKNPQKAQNEKLYQGYFDF